MDRKQISEIHERATAKLMKGRTLSRPLTVGEKRRAAELIQKARSGNYPRRAEESAVAKPINDVSARTDASDIRLLEAENARLRSALQRVISWLDRLADQSERQAKTYRFASLAEACAADAKNYRATADTLRQALTE